MFLNGHDVLVVKEVIEEICAVPRAEQTMSIGKRIVCKKGSRREISSILPDSSGATYRE
jgi:uncharacterized protein YlzI (FlbEa/FlbD family)